MEKDEQAATSWQRRDNGDSRVHYGSDTAVPLRGLRHRRCEHASVFRGLEQLQVHGRIVASAADHDPKLIEIMQPLAAAPNEAWTDDILTCLDWFESRERRSVLGKQLHLGASRRRRKAAG